MLGTSLAAAIAIGLAPACGPSTATQIPQPTPAQLEAAGLGRLPVAPQERRVDLAAPPFSASTEITNPLFPIGRLHSAILNGRVDDKRFKVETTLLPDTRVIEWSPGQCVRTAVSQYVAYLGGRIHEVALDFYAQADDGSVWYFGEDVFNYRRGVLADLGGSWLAGKEGPAAMIMPGAPAVGNVLRPENVPGLVFEEVTVKRTGQTVDGPRGRVAGAIVTSELHDDGSREEKVFAPGYGEFFTAGGGDVEALALAVPTDAAGGGPPAALARLFDGAVAIADGRARSAGRVTAAWRAVRAGGVPPRLVAPTDRAVHALARTTQGRRRQAALDVAQAALDVQLRYRPVAEIDRARLDLWARQLLLDAAARDLRAVRGDHSTLEWIRDRIVGAVDGVALVRIDRRLEALHDAIAERDLAAASRIAKGLRG
jgi:hypothetical protein